MEGVDLNFDDKSLAAIAEKAIERKTGARGLRSIMENLLLDTMFDLPDLENVEGVVIKEEMVMDSKPPVYVHSDKKKKAKSSSKDDDNDSGKEKASAS